MSDAAPASSRRRLRRDGAANRRRLLDAAGILVRRSDTPVTVPAVAQAAGLSTATAYRHFASLDDLVTAYLHLVTTQLRDFSHDCPQTGPALFEAVMREWLRLLTINGEAQIQIRSRRGFLERLHEGDAVIGAVRDAWERPIRMLLREDGLPDSVFDPALWMINALLDPREILDLRGQGLTDDQIVSRCLAAIRGAVRGWAAAAE